MTEQALIQLVRQVMLDAARLEYGGLKKEQPEHLFSPAFERKMKKLLRRRRHPLWNKTLRAAACLLAVAAAQRVCCAGCQFGDPGGVLRLDMGNT